ERAVNDGDPDRLREPLNRILCGSRYMAQRDQRYPRTYNVLDMIDETDEYITELGRQGGKQIEGKWRAHYDFRCEFVHPSMGSFAIYQRRVGNEYVFSRRFGDEPSHLPDLLRGIRASSGMLLREAKPLQEMPELPPDWQGFRK